MELETQLDQSHWLHQLHIIKKIFSLAQLNRKVYNIISHILGINIIQSCCTVIRPL